MASAGINAFIRALVLKATTAAARRTAKDAEETVPMVHRPTGDIPLDDPTDAPTFFGPSTSQLDRNPLVLERYDEIIKDNPNVKFSGTVEDHLDEIERDLIDAGELGDIGKQTTARKPWEFELEGGKRKDVTTTGQAKQVETYIDPKLSPAATHFRELENLDRFLKGEPEVPITRDVPEGTRQDLRATAKIPRSDDIDITNARREAQITLLKEQLEKQPELATRANLGELAEDVVAADVLDKAGKQFFGRKVAQEGDDFSMRDLEDLFLRGKSAEGKLNIDPETGRPTTPQGRAVLKAKAEGTKQVQGRSRGPKDIPIVPTGERSFGYRKRPDPEGMEKPVEGEVLSPQEKLTGPLKEEARISEAQIAANARAHRDDLRAISEGRNDLTPRQQALKDVIDRTGRLTRKAIEKINKDFPPVPVRLSPRREAGKQTTVESAVREQRGTKQRERGEEPKEVPEETTKFTVFDEATGEPQVDEAGRIVSDFIDRTTAAPDSDLFGRTMDELSKARQIIAKQGGVDLSRTAAKPVAGPTQDPNLVSSLLQALREIQKDASIGPPRIRPELAFKSPPKAPTGELTPAINQLINMMEQLNIKGRPQGIPTPGIPSQARTQGLSKVQQQLEERFKEAGTR
jgi:hypothetical protein